MAGFAAAVVIARVISAAVYVALIPDAVVAVNAVEVVAENVCIYRFGCSVFGFVS